MPGINVDFLEALDMLEREKGISREALLDAVRQALVAAYKKHYHGNPNVRVDIDERSGTLRVVALKRVVETVEDPSTEISLEEARRIDPSVSPEDMLEVEVTPQNFGRVAAQTAKHVVTQRLREAEREILYEMYAPRVGELFTGTVRREDARYVYVDLGRGEGLLPRNEVLPGESFRPGDRVKAVLVKVERTSKGPLLFLSRTAPEMLKRLLEREVPEIASGIVEIRAVSREPGERSKVAVYSRHPHVDPIGTCVGPKGARILAVSEELGGERIDVIRYSPDPAEFIRNALSPARVSDVRFLGERVARVIVPDDQFSLAIGRRGQNARLAARLTGYKIDIRSESDANEYDGRGDEAAAFAPSDDGAAEPSAQGDTAGADRGVQA
ncbi:NusA antitermination factor [Brockia lithotrophica]|uniref:Transcription termination/antitermination protein NusA n=1 Tax=Brockia lithotrophica TaxID=933949 RepID=A0A660KX13_9BACL|nr:transcription termination factor NusA [Brockia lithotrophica]RKQ84231.1 NusA antitermination factor [Brockia lithotrophica]